MKKYYDTLEEQVEDIVKNLDLEIGLLEVDDNNEWFSVQVHDNYSNMYFWIDFKYGYENENDDYKVIMDMDWNQYIFNLNDYDDLLRQALQANSDFMENAFDLVECYTSDEAFTMFAS